MDGPHLGPGADDQQRDPSAATPSDRRLSPGATAFLGLGLSIGLCFALMVGLGVLLDGWLGTSPILLLVGLGLGTVLAVLMAVATVRKYL